jgi:glucose-6-phosphate 1-dehydrogenase
VSEDAKSDALVFFGATGDLAHKMIFPALQALVKKGHLDVPVIGVAKAGWNVDQLRERARDSLEKFGGGVDAAAFAKLSGLLRYVDGDYADPKTFDQVRTMAVTSSAKALAHPRRPGTREPGDAATPESAARGADEQRGGRVEK